MTPRHWTSRLRPLAVGIALLAAGSPASAGSLRFHGNGVGDIDRTKIPIDAPARPVDVAGDFTLEFWLRALTGENDAAECLSGSDGWIYGNIVFDRDVYGAGDLGDYGVSLFADDLAFGVAVGNDGQGVCGGGPLADGRWHHVAVARRSADGWMALFVDGALSAEVFGPTGSIAYRNGRSTSWPDSDPYLVIGAEKHDAGPAYPSFRGWVDEVRISSVVRYTGDFARPTAPFAADAFTVGLYHCDEATGDTLHDTSAASGGPSHGLRRFGGTPAGPEWSASSFTDPITGAPPLHRDVSFIVRPHPARAATRFEFALSTGSPVRLRLFDVLGRHVRTLSDGPRGAGAHSLPWDLEDEAGRPVVPGFYRAELVIGERTLWRPVIVVR